MHDILLHCLFLTRTSHSSAPCDPVRRDSRVSPSGGNVESRTRHFMVSITRRACIHRVEQGAPSHVQFDVTISPSYHLDGQRRMDRAFFCVSDLLSSHISLDRLCLSTIAFTVFDIQLPHLHQGACYIPAHQESTLFSPKAHLVIRLSSFISLNSTTVDPGHRSSCPSDP
jgi:hypothetical protein